VTIEFADLPVEVDLLVLGSGGAGMTAALTAAALGLDVALIEKTDMIGGTTAYSAGSVWVPNTRHDLPNSDDRQHALTYLRHAVGDRLDEGRATAFLQTAPEMVDFLEDHTGLRLRAYPYHPDYLANLDGATTAGRVLEPHPFDASVLGAQFSHIRPPPPEFTLFGGMMVDRTDIKHLMVVTRSLSSFGHAFRLIARYYWDRLRFPRGTRLVMGNALVGRLYHALLQRDVPILRLARTVALKQSEGRISSVVVACGGNRREIRVRAGVVLATGGLSRHAELRQQLMPGIPDTNSPVVDSATGDGLALAETLGGHLAPPYDNNSFWAPVSKRRRADGSIAVFPHFVLDRGKPGAIAVGPNGHRFVNEATSYHLFGGAMISALNGTSRTSCYLLCDDAFIEKYGLGMVRPKRLGLQNAIRRGYLTTAGSIPELADKIDVPKVDLAATVDRHNGFADSGIDEEFAKGDDAYQQNLGDPGHQPNPCIGPISQPPYYALEIFPGDIGASIGLMTDEQARVLGADNEPIVGLYACGNDMDSIMAGHYPGPGITLGPAMTFAYAAARHAYQHLAGR